VVDTAQADYGFDTTGSVTLLNGVGTGTDFTNRIGRKVCWKSFLIQGTITANVSPASAGLCRIAIIYDTQPNGALPAIGDIFNAAVASSPLNLNNRDRFRVLWDKFFAPGTFNNGATLATQWASTGIVRKYRKINLETIYDGITAAIADIQSGSIMLVTLGSVAPGVRYEFRGSVRLRFNDA